MAEGIEVGTGYVSIVPSAAGFGAALESQITGQAALVGQKTGQALSAGITGSASGAAKSVAGVLAAVGAARFVRGSLNEAEEAVRVGNLTAAVIKSTGGAAGVTADQVQKLADSLSKMAGIDDEVIQGAENVLLTFTRVSGQVFPQATKAALDMSAALGGDLQGSVIQLGKALNDPLQGMTALRRVGVSFTQEQQAQIKALQETGDLLGAQKIILEEVNREFGGAAEANATATDRLGVAMGNLQESLGTALLPTVNAAATGLTGLLTGFTALPGPVQTVAGALAGLGAASIAIGLLAPKIAQARVELEGMGRAGTFASRSLGTLGKVGAGLVAITATVEGLNLLGDAITRLAAGPVAPVNALTRALVELGSNGQVTGELAKQLGGDLGQLNEKAFEAKGGTNPIAKLGSTLAGVLNPSIKDSRRDVDSLDKALAGLVSGGHADVAAAALERLTAAIRRGPDGEAAAEQFTGQLNDYKEALNGVDVQALLTGSSVDAAGNAIDESGNKAADAAPKFGDLHDQLADLVATDWSKELASNFESALNPLDKFTFNAGKDIADLKGQVATAKADLTKAAGDLAKLEGTGTAGDIARIRGQAGDIDAARAAVDEATRKFNKTKADLAEAQKSPLSSITENLGANLAGLNAWLDNFNTLVKGGHESLAKHLLSLGPSAADAMAEAVGVSPKQLDNLQGLWDKADTKIADISSGQFELNADQAGKPGETLAEIIAARYRDSLTPKFTAATLFALNQATAAILAAETPTGDHEGQAGLTAGAANRAGTVAPPAPPAGPVAAQPAAAPIIERITGFAIDTTVNVKTDANPQEIAAEVGDHLAWRFAPRPTMVG